MCTKIPTCNEMVSFTNLPCFSTMRRFGIPILKGAEPEESLVVYTKTNEFRVDRTGKRITERNPMEPLQCENMLDSMELGLTQSATVLWVKVPSTFSCSMLHEGEDSPVTEEIDKAKMAELMRGQWDFAKMPSVELAPPAEATHWLVCQPLNEDTTIDLYLGILQQKAKGIWKTKDKIYFIVPVGYKNVVCVQEENAESDGLMDEATFFEANVKPYRETCQKILDDWTDAERKKKEAFPELQRKARELVQSYANSVEAMREMDPKFEATALMLDAAEENFIYDEVFEPLTQETMEKFLGISNQLQQQQEQLAQEQQQQANEEEKRLSRIESFRNVLRDLDVKITVRDFAGILVQEVPPRCFGKTVEADLLESEIVITVLKSGKKCEERHFSYTEPGEADELHAMLVKLGLDYFSDDLDEKPKKCRFLEKFLNGTKA